MASERDRQHIIIPFAPTAESYQKPPRKITPKPLPVPADRTSHGESLRDAFTTAVDDARDARDRSGIRLTGDPAGIRVQFESPPNVPLKLESLGHASKGIEVLTVVHETTGEGDDKQVVERATVFVPDGQAGHFVDRFEKYAHETTKTGKRPNQAVVDRIATLRHATLRALWTDAPELFPEPGNPIWWEVWLRSSGGDEVGRFYEYAGLTGLRVKERRLHFTDRVVVLAFGTLEQMAASSDVLNDLAEVQRAKETAGFFMAEPASEQALWIADLQQRTEPPPSDAPAVCILDAGVNRGHPLLAPALLQSDCLTVEPGWGAHDHHPDGHGTAMAGLALYGDLTDAMASSAPVTLRHRLESVKILPPTGANEPELYAAVTAEATSRAEIQNPHRARVYSMAVTTLDDRDRGQPSSWSAAVDALAAGRSFDATTKGLEYFDDAESPRLLVVSAGNGDSAAQPDVLARCDTELVEDPAQAWNALVVGACTDKITLTDPSLTGYEPASPRGELSPWSTTSVSFAKQWPNKPDVVMEGGNGVVDPAGAVLSCDDLSLLTTSHQPSQRPLTITWATSPATAQVARIAAAISAEYPLLWPETVRALVVHSARWTPRMKEQLDAESSKRRRARLFRRYGFGVPSLERALKSAADSATLLAQGTIRPFDDGKMGNIHLHELPWPADALRALGDARVTLRVTLSYFIEPNPGRRGWRRPHRYQSHGLRFDMKGPIESDEAFHKRLNKNARDEDEGAPSKDTSGCEWYLGPEARDRGSMHSDYMFEATGADLAEQNVVAVYPVTGWWKELKKRDRSKHGARYALVVTIETDEVDADIWTPIANQVGIPIAVEA